MRRTYHGAVCKGSGSYGIVFLDFPGCISAGDTLDEVLAMGSEALQGHVKAMQEDGDLIPSPSQHDLADLIAWLGDDEDDLSDEQWFGLYPIAVDIAGFPNAASIPVNLDLIHEISDYFAAGTSDPTKTTPIAASTREFIEQATRRELDRLKKSA